MFINSFYRYTNKGYSANSGFEKTGVKMASVLGLAGILPIWHKTRINKSIDQLINQSMHHM